MKTRTKVSGQYQRRYASGILMYRERMNLIEIPANATVHILRTEAKRTLCTYKDDRMYIPNENLPKRKAEAPPAARKKILVKLSTQAIVEAEVAAATPAPAAEPVAETQAPAPVVETAPIAEPIAELAAEPVLA